MTSRAVVRTQLHADDDPHRHRGRRAGAAPAAAAGARPDVRRHGVGTAAARAGRRRGGRRGGGAARRAAAGPGRSCSASWRARHPGLDAEAVAFGVSYWVPWVQPPPRGLWSASSAAVMTTVAAWLGEGAPGVPGRPRRPLPRGAFGPASVRDVQAWCGLTRLREVVDRLGPRLRRFRTEDGGELFDVPGAPLPDPDTPAPVRFLAEYDNVVLSHADRSRVVADGEHVLLPGGPGGWTGTVLVDGLLRATWAARREGDATALTVRPSGPVVVGRTRRGPGRGGAAAGLPGAGPGAPARLLGRLSRAKTPSGQ